MNCALEKQSCNSPIIASTRIKHLRCLFDTISSQRHILQPLKDACAQLFHPKPVSKSQMPVSPFVDLAEKQHKVPLAPSAFHSPHKDSSRRALPVPRLSAPQVRFTKDSHTNAYFQAHHAETVLPMHATPFSAI